MKAHPRPAGEFTYVVHLLGQYHEQDIGLLLLVELLLHVFVLVLHNHQSQAFPVALSDHIIQLLIHEGNSSSELSSAASHISFLNDKAQKQLLILRAVEKEKLAVVLQ